MSGGKHTEKALGIFTMFGMVENLVPYCFGGDLQNQVAAAIRETENAVRDFVEALDEPAANVAAIRSALKEAAGVLDLVVKYNMGPNLAIERAWKAKTLALAALLNKAEAKEGAHEESENAAIDAANISGAVRMEAEMARKEAGTLDDLVASIRQRSRDAIPAGMQCYSDALNVFADNLAAAIKIERAGASAMRDALRSAHRTLRLVVENAADVLQPHLCEEVVHTGKAVEAALSAAGNETEGAK